MFKPLHAVVALAGVAVLLLGCETEPSSPAEKESLRDQVQAALTEMKEKDPGLDDLLEDSYGYAIFPSVGAGGLVVGGAYGRGEVYRQGEFIGYAELNQGSVGLQAGGQEYAELLVFDNQNALQRFMNDEFSFGAEASAVALKAGAATTANFKDGVAVFTMPKGGLMFDVSLTGQQFNFEPKTEEMRTEEIRTEEPITR